MDKTIYLKPRLSEKTYSLSEKRVYVLDITSNINKQKVAQVLMDQFDVKVKKVRLLNQKGKSKRVVSLSGKRYLSKLGKRSDFKKAYVTLEEGHSLPFFASVIEEEKKEKQAQAKVDKAMAKKDKKDSAKKIDLKRKKDKEDK